MDNNVYVYKEGDIFGNVLYQKKKLMSFISNLGYIWVDMPADEVEHMCLSHLIRVRFPMEVQSREERKVIFGKT